MKQETIDRIRKFTEDRDWDQFHTPANLAKSISIEANELLECFQWSDTEYDVAHVREELADVMVYCRNLLDKLDMDEDEIINEKMSKNEAKYPVDKARGKADKYDRLCCIHFGKKAAGSLFFEGSCFLMETLNAAINQVNTILWSYVLIVLLIGLGLYFTFRTGFVQIRLVGEMVRLLAEGFLHQHGQPRGRGQYCRRCHCYCAGRAGGHLLDVDGCRCRKCHRFCGKHSGPDL